MTRALVVASAALAVGCFDPHIQHGDGGAPSGGISINIAKTGAYSGLHLDPGLYNAADCPDKALEPNDGPGAAPFGPPILLAPAADQPVPRVTSMAICPTVPNPATQQHDVDWFKVVADAPVTILAQAFYDVAYGDLDLAIVDGGGNILVSDGSAVSNACAASSVAAGTYFVVVVGAGNGGVNRYELSVRTYAQPVSCGVSDLGPARD